MDHNISFAEAFFEDEVREGFFVPTMMKRYWAAQIKVLSVIDAICEKHGINWFADYGTLMGAVRHDGYIPWDDDLDICMLRSDYKRFWEVAKKELPKEYVLMTLDKQPEYRELIGRVVNSHSIDYSDRHMKEFYGCPYTVGIDIFPLDGLYDDPEKEAERKARAQKVLSAYGIICAEGEKAHKLKFLLPEIESENGVRLKMGPGLERETIRLLERIYSECADTDAERVALMRFYVTDGNHIYARKVFESYVELPFENTYVRVPARYDEKLRTDYGNYMNVVKSGGVHGYPVYAEQERILSEHIGRKPYRYNFDNQALLASVRRYILRATSTVQNKDKRKVVFLPCRVKWWNAMESLWKMAIDNTGVEVHVLPIPYNERNYAGDYLDDHDEKDMFPDYVNVQDHEEYDFEAEHPDVIVMQVPYDDFSTAIAVPDYYYSHNLLKCTDELVYVPCFDMDAPVSDGDKAEMSLATLIEQPAVVNADRIVLQSDRMKQVYIKKLVELTGEPTREYWNQKIVLGDEIGQLYGWKQSIHSEAGKADKTVSDEWASLLGNQGNKKVIVYFVSISFIMQGGNRAIDKIRRVLTQFAENEDNLVAVVVPQKALLTELERLDDKLWKKFRGIISEMAKNWSNCIYDPEGVAERYIEMCDAFYGDSGVLARKFVINKKPVMIQNIDL